MQLSNVGRKVLSGTAVGALAATMLATPAIAQAPQSMVTGGESTFSITPYAGYMWFGDLAEYASGSGLSNDDNWIVGGQAKVRISSRWAVAGNFAYTKTNFQLEPGSSSATSPVPTSGRIGYWLMDADLQYMLPFGTQRSRIAPFVQGGIGAVRYTVDPNDYSSASQTDLAFNAGVGIEAQAGPVGLQIMLKDYVTSLDWSDFRDFTSAVNDDTIDRSKVANNIALTAGLRISF